MADSGVSLELTPESERVLRSWVRDKPRQVEAAINSWLDRMAAWCLRGTMRAFDESQQTGGTRWLPNRGLYAQWKGTMHATRGGTLPGILSGALRGSFLHAGNANQIKDINRTAKTATIGSRLPYAASFYYGIKGKRTFTAVGSGGKRARFTVNGTPPRPYFPHRGVAEPHGAKLFNDLLVHHMKEA